MLYNCVHIYTATEVGRQSKASFLDLFFVTIKSIIGIPKWWRETRGIEWFIEDQAFSTMYDIAPPPLPHPILSASCLSFSVFLCVASRAELKAEGEGDGGGGKSFDVEKIWSSINHSILWRKQTPLLHPKIKKSSSARSWKFSKEDDESEASPCNFVFKAVFLNKYISVLS
jgi:hypothetical protein